MSKILGYAIALIGLAIIVFSLNIPAFKISLPASIKPVYITIGGLAIVIAGVIPLFGNSAKTGSVKQATEEVPIYEGEGKKKKIVGYKREAKK